MNDVSNPVVLLKVNGPMQTVLCHGWWEQAGFDRQPVNALQLAFRDGDVFGQGHDIVGTFVMNGQVRFDHVQLIKTCVGAHQVEYPGTFDGEGTFRWILTARGGQRSLADQNQIFQRIVMRRC